MSGSKMEFGFISCAAHAWGRTTIAILSDREMERVTMEFESWRDDNGVLRMGPVTYFVAKDGVWGTGPTLGEAQADFRQVSRLWAEDTPF